MSSVFVLKNGLACPEDGSTGKVTDGRPDGWDSTQCGRVVATIAKAERQAQESKRSIAKRLLDWFNGVSER